MRRDPKTGSFELHDPLFTECKFYTQLSIRSDPMFETAQEANRLVQEYLRERQLIVYGGEAIDGAVRLRGGALYSDDNIPDYDFYSPDSVMHAYELADILFNAGMTGARAINGIHFGTMRVDAGDNHFVADLSYIPEKIFNIIPTITTPDGVRRTAMSYQRCDIHRALSKPFLDPPNEAIFNRLAKDISRYNLLEEYYPAKELAELITSQPHPDKEYEIPTSCLTRPLVGLAASRIYISLFSGVPRESQVSRPGYISLSLPAPFIERISTEIPSVTRKWFGDLLTDVHETVISPGVIAVTGRTHGQIIPYVQVVYNNIIVRLACVQYVLWWLLSHFWASRAGAIDKNIGDEYLREYISLSELVHTKGSHEPALAPYTDLHYGDLNESAAAHIQRARSKYQTDPKNNPAPVKAPTNYSPGKSQSRPHWDNTIFESVAH